MKLGTKRKYDGILDVPARKLAGVEVRHLHKPAGTTLTSGTMRTAFFGQDSEKLTYAEPTVWHELSQEGHGVWMTDLPIEQRQTDDLIGRSKGRVLVGGLGLGYAVVALAARPKVTEIVVVEANAAIIKLVWAATVKRVKARSTTKRPVKLTIIHADLFDYLKERQAAKLDRPEFAWGLFDIWQADGETVFHQTVVPLRALAHGIVASLVCWNEDVMRAQLLQGLHTRLTLLTLPEARRVMFAPTLLPTLDQLTADSDHIWTQWAVPFWRWFKDHAYRDGVYDEELVHFVMSEYVRNYGRPEASNGVPALRPYRSKALAEMTEVTTDGDPEPEPVHP